MEIKRCRSYKREAELARMSWKINPEDLLPTHLGAKGQFGSRFSLGRLSLPVMKKDVVVHVFLHQMNVFFSIFSEYGIYGK